MNDPVNHPSHYTQGKIECIDFITDKKLNFCRGNAIKYIIRAGIKDPSKEIEDLEKAIFYIKHEIKELEKAKQDAEQEKLKEMSLSNIMLTPVCNMLEEDAHD